MSAYVRCIYKGSHIAASKSNFLESSRRPLRLSQLLLDANAGHDDSRRSRRSFCPSHLPVMALFLSARSSHFHTESVFLVARATRIYNNLNQRPGEESKTKRAHNRLPGGLACSCNSIDSSAAAASMISDRILDLGIATSLAATPISPNQFVCNDCGARSSAPVLLTLKMRAATPWCPQCLSLTGRPASSLASMHVNTYSTSEGEFSEP